MSDRERQTWSPDLTWLVEQIWQTSQPDSPVIVTVEPRLPPGFRPVDRLLVIPDVRRPRFLVPLTSPRVAQSSLVRYNRLRPVPLQLARAVLGTAMLLPVGRRRLGTELVVGVREELAGGTGSDVLLLEYLREQLGLEHAPAAGIGVHPADPNRKPTLQLFAPDGNPVGYAKFGWNDATRALVRNEATSLQRVRDQIGTLGTPELLFHGNWRGAEVAVTAPLPRGVRAYRQVDDPPEPGHLQAIAAVGGGRRSTLAESSYWQRTRARVDEFCTGITGEQAALLRRVEHDLRSAGSPLLSFGTWHGDWVPWNLARHGTGLQTWDWEHSGPDVPLGFDLCHWHFQVALVLRGRPASEAARAAHLALPGLRQLGLPERAARLVVALYLLEMLLRTWQLKQAGGGWNPKLFPDLLHALGDVARDLAHAP